MTKITFGKTGAFGTPLYSEAAITGEENIKASSGILMRILVTDGSAGIIKIYDATSGTTDKIIEIDTTNADNYEINANCDNGIRWSKTGTAKVTLIYA